MMRRAFPNAPRANICQICELQYSNTRSIKRTLASLSTSRLRTDTRKQLPSQSLSIRPLARTFTTSRQRQAQQPSTDSPIANHVISRSQGQQVTDPASLAALVDRVTSAFLAQQGIPSEKTTYDALRAVGQIDVDALDETEPLSELRSDADGHSETTNLLDLDGKKQKKKTRAPAPAPAARSPLGKQELVRKISDAAYTIVTHPTVVLTPRILDEYVKIQARLGKPQTLTEIFSLYRLKPLPRNVGGTIRFDNRNPDKVQNAVPARIADRALDAAIAAKDLDSAVGIIANTYAAQPFLRSKLLNKAVLPGMALGLVPAVAYGLASSMSLLQDSMDQSSATGIAFAAILAYVAFTGTIGVVVITTSNDQMRRVTWLPGLPLRQRWLREEERAALDKVACAFGFQEQHRYGEENGPEFQALRNYIFSRGMVLDAVELMEGMN
ncbi:hypothetical protein CONLIGDRAFT_6799 [Coniochaeta ligniaria NRRL 30616]|uniref:Uncharacterized protein n=1 Tax=Coniochaeta ligniaria NRRL 30616 TaxID=1408157 RepID=A0A1J7J540_9PEZI|nr:hypothetical protein CONLIGDRAFT_6799 [Coniochaeta ligniaria NRRL 30616]